MLGQKDLLKARIVVFDEGTKEEPGSRNVDPKRNVVRGVCEISEIHPSPTGIEQRTHAFNRAAVGAKLVEEHVDVTAALVRGMVGNWPAMLVAQIVDRDWKPTELSIDAGGRLDEAPYDLYGAVACFRIARRIEPQARSSQR
jgi:hypothetical protein